MKKNISVAVLGSTGYVGLELINIMSHHPNVDIKFLGSDTNFNTNVKIFDKRISDDNLPHLDKFNNLDFNSIDIVFLALPHKVSQAFINENQSALSNLKIVDLSADFRLDNVDIYKKNYNVEHTCPDLLSKFVYGSTID